MFRRPYLIVSVLALITLGGAGYSATGGNFILGRLNTATNQTRLVTPLAGQSLNITNPSTAAGSTALGLNVSAGRPPMAVNSTVKVSKLNADLLDGVDSSQLPRKISFSYNLPPGGVSAPILVPPDVPVTLTGTQLTSGFRGVGTVALLRSDAGNFLEWTGLESTAGSVITQGFSSGQGTHIVFLDFSHQVDVEVNDGDTIRVHNTSSGTRTGNVTLIW